MGIASALLDLLFPRACAGCDGLVVDGAVFCATCAVSVEVPGARERGLIAARLGPVGLRAGGLYGGQLAVAIRRLKYGGRFDLGPALGTWLGGAIGPVEADAVVPVPLHPSRLRERGYNQADLLARGLVAAGAGGVRRRGWLERVAAGAPQASLDAEARASALAGAFRASPRVAGRRVLLVDDVVTTGATAKAAASALLTAGARSVTLCAVALSG